MQFNKLRFWTETRRSKDWHPTEMNQYLCKVEGLSRLLGKTAVSILGEKMVQIGSQRCIEINVKACFYTEVSLGLASVFALSHL